MKYYLALPLFFLMSCGGSEETESSDNTAEKIDITSNEDELVAEEESESDLVEDFIESDCEVNLRAYISDPDEAGPTNIRATPGGEVVLELGKHMDDYFLDLEATSNGWFKVTDKIGGIDVDYDIPGGVGWIHGSVIGLDTRNYGGQELKFYSEPKEEASVSGTINHELHVHLIDVCGEWAKVKGNADGKKIEGWIQIEWLCGNPLTNCS